MTITEEQGGFDLERARGLRDFLQDDCAEVGDVWAEMVTEIERLRADLEQAEICIRARLEVIEQLQAENEELQESLTDAYLLGSHKKTKELAPRIKALEDALVEAKAAIKFCLDEGDEDENYGLMHDLPEWRELPEKDKGVFRDWCRKQLQAVGTIGPDARPQCWQITEERTGAIDRAMRFLGWAEHAGKTQDVHVATDVSVLRAMLNEAE